MRPSSCRRPQRFAFTLVELLVVIAIVALLISFLMPALQSARDQAKLVDDLSRIRQCAMISISMYANDNKGDLLPVWGIRNGFPSAFCLEMNGWGGTIPNATDAPYNVTWVDLIQMYVDRKNQRDDPNFKQYSPILYCSNDPQWSAAGDGWRFSGLYREFSWRMNYAVTPSVTDFTTFKTTGQFGRKVSRVRDPARKVLLAESHYEGVGGVSGICATAETWAWGAGVLSKDSIPTAQRWPPIGAVFMQRHRSGFVAAYCDGHAAVIPFAVRDDFRNGATFGTGPNWDLDAR